MYEIAIGDRAYSSWSLRGWLLFERFGIPCKVHHARLTTDEFATMIKGFYPSRTVPAVRFPDVTIGDSLAIAEELASRHPEAGIWPHAAKLRAIARALVAEMHSGFRALRQGCPMNLRVSYIGFPVDESVIADLRRLEAIWDHAWEASGGPWLCGAYSAADVFFAPVAARIATYDLKVSARAGAYVEAHLADPAFRRWRAMSLIDGDDRPEYSYDCSRREWPGPRPLAARAVELGKPENAFCPYSGKPAVHLMEISGRLFGFCNAFCRNKTMADPTAWPKFMQLYRP